LGDEPTQLRRLTDAIEARLLQVQEEKEEALEKIRVAQQEKDEIRVKLEDDKDKM
jgi:hypothetical protein